MLIKVLWSRLKKQIPAENVVRSSPSMLMSFSWLLTWRRWSIQKIVKFCFEINCYLYAFFQASQVVVVLKNLPAGNIRDTGTIPGSGRFPGGGHPWQPTPVFLPGISHGQSSLTSFSPWDSTIGHIWSNLAHTYAFFISILHGIPFRRFHAVLSVLEQCWENTPVSQVGSPGMAVHPCGSYFIPRPSSSSCSKAALHVQEAVVLRGDGIIKRSVRYNMPSPAACIPESATAL